MAAERTFRPAIAVERVGNPAKSGLDEAVLGLVLEVVDASPEYGAGVDRRPGWLARLDEDEDYPPASACAADSHQ